jgi:hypothetical protein
MFTIKGNLWKRERRILGDESVITTLRPLVRRGEVAESSLARNMLKEQE